MSIEEIIQSLKFNEEEIIPVIAQQHDSKDVLMQAWMNADAVRETLTTGQVCYWSRSRQALWRKGETSGHTRQLIELRIDCDKDSILVFVDQIGPACHTNRPSCFYHAVRQGQVEIISEPKQ